MIEEYFVSRFKLKNNLVIRLRGNQLPGTMLKPLAGPCCLYFKCRISESSGKCPRFWGDLCFSLFSALSKDVFFFKEE